MAKKISIILISIIAILTLIININNKINNGELESDTNDKVVIEPKKYKEYTPPSEEELHRCLNQLTKDACSIIPNVNETIRPMEQARMLYEFGYTPDYDIPGAFHNGIDLDMDNDGKDYPIYPIAPGIVIYVHEVNEVDECYDPNQIGRCEQKGISPTGNHVTILHQINGMFVSTTYGHLQTKTTMKNGDFVNVYDQIGLMGNTGNSEWDHLHMHTEYWVEGTRQRTFKHSKDPREFVKFPEQKDYFYTRMAE